MVGWRLSNSEPKPNNCEGFSFSCSTVTAKVTATRARLGRDGPTLTAGLGRPELGAIPGSHRPSATLAASVRQAKPISRASVARALWGGDGEACSARIEGRGDHLDATARPGNGSSPGLPPAGSSGRARALFARGCKGVLVVTAGRHRTTADAFCPGPAPDSGQARDAET